PGLAGVTVILHGSVNGVTTEIARTTTDENGHYLFDHLDHGNYTVEFVTPDGYLPSPKNVGDDDNVDSDGKKV
ncbi:SdrD B-like domain-containing protein, partial [Staphylococcus muscae]